MPQHPVPRSDGYLGVFSPHHQLPVVVQGAGFPTLGENEGSTESRDAQKTRSDADSPFSFLLQGARSRGGGQACLGGGGEEPGQHLAGEERSRHAGGCPSVCGAPPRTRNTRGKSMPCPWIRNDSNYTPCVVCPPPRG